VSRSERLEGVVQVVLMLAVGGLAGAASFSHVAHLAIAHGQPGWLAWADAAVLETMATSAGLEIRRRRRRGRPAAFVLVVLAAAVGLSLAAQVAEAEPSVWGWTMAALPAVGFLCLVKIALGRTVAHGPSPQVATAPVAVEGGASAAAVPAESAAAAAVPDGDEPSPPAGTEVVDGLLLVGQAVAGELAASARALTRDALAEGVRARGHAISTARASELLRQLRAA